MIKKLDSKKIEQNGWRQGACLLVDSQSEIYITTQCKQEQLPIGKYIVLSQDCDILNFSLEKEPVIELIRANTVVECKAELTFGKNPRQLHNRYTELKQLDFDYISFMNGENGVIAHDIVLN